MSKDLNDFTDNADFDSIHRHPDGKGTSVRVQSKFIEHMLSSDKPECEFKRGDIVEKTTLEKGDIHPIGTKGIVIGTLYEKKVGEAYLVLYNTNEMPTFTVKSKLKLVEE